jgi:ferritin-like metal-binding protein YciE
MPDLTEKLKEAISDAHAMEQNVLRQLEDLISSTPDEPMRTMFQHHHEETQAQIQRLEERMAAYDIDAAALKDLVTQAGAFFKGVADMARSDKPKKNARDAFVTEHFEIAEYETLQRIATRAGDTATAEVARQNCGEEREMARKLDESWDYVVDRLLEEEGVEGAPRFTREVDTAATRTGTTGTPTVP